MEYDKDRAEKIATARKMVQQWIEAEQVVMTGQEYRIEGSRSLKRPDLRMIGERIKYWQDELARLEGRHRIRVRQVIPRDV